MADKKIAEQYYTPPPKLSGWESFRLFLWNGETSEVLGRTAASWGKPSIILFSFYCSSVIFRISCNNIESIFIAYSVSLSFIVFIVHHRHQPMH